MTAETVSQKGATPWVFVRAMRPHQWTKNALLFSGLFLNARLTHSQLWLDATAGFMIFCLLSGSAYIINDLQDREADRNHPKKSQRPIAAGLIAPSAAAAWAGILAIVALGSAWFFGLHFFATAGCYWLLVLAYSMGLKHLVIVDVMALASGFVLRALGGIYILERSWDPAWGALPLTAWFLACTMFLSLFIALCKRRAEMVGIGEGAAQTRRVLEHYSVPLLDQLISMMSALTVVTYALYCVQERAEMVVTIPFVLFGVMRFLWHVYRNDEGGAPEILLFKDKTLLLNVMAWIITLLYLLSAN
jgi:4-hydroxybenzoate polyprenyltransferase